MEHRFTYVFDIKDKNTYGNNRRWIGMSEMKNKVNLSAYKKEIYSGVPDCAGFIPMTEADIDEDWEAEKVYDYARADLGLDAFNPTPQRFLTEEISFGLMLAERRYIMVYYGNEILKDAAIFAGGYEFDRIRFGSSLVFGTEKPE